MTGAAGVLALTAMAVPAVATAPAQAPSDGSPTSRLKLDCFAYPRATAKVLKLTAEGPTSVPRSGGPVTFSWSLKAKKRLTKVHGWFTEKTYYPPRRFGKFHFKHLRRGTHRLTRTWTVHAQRAANHKKAYFRINLYFTGPRKQSLYAVCDTTLPYGG